MIGIELDFENMIYFECSERVMEGRLLGRAKTSGRADDNPDTIRKRFQVFNEQTKPIALKMQKEPNFVITVNAERPPEEVFADLKQKMLAEGYKLV